MRDNTCNSNRATRQTGVDNHVTEVSCRLVTTSVTLSEIRETEMYGTPITLADTNVATLQGKRERQRYTRL